MISTFSVKVYVCRDAAASAHCYNTFDNQKRRSPQVALDTFQLMSNSSVVTDKGNKVSSKLLIQIGSSIRNANNGFKKESASNQRQVHDITNTESINFINFIGDLYAELFKGSAKEFGNAAKRLLPNSVLASFYGEFVSDESNARDFISAYFLTKQVAAEHPAMTLHKRIAFRPKCEHAALSYTTFVKACHCCWTAFKESRNDVTVDDLSVDKLSKYAFPNDYMNW